MKPKKMTYYGFYYTVGNNDKVYNALFLASSKKKATERFWNCFGERNGVELREVYKQTKSGDFRKLNDKDLNVIFGMMFYTVVIATCILLCLVF